MDKVWVYDYPDAKNKRDMYQRIMDDLEKQYDIIAEIRDIRISSTELYLDETGTQKGSYYNKYVEYVELWQEDAEKMRDAIRTAASDINERKLSAQRKRDEWNGRINLGHYVEVEGEEENEQKSNSSYRH